MIIGISGLIGSGKGTVGDILVNHYDFTKISFADKLKDTVALIFDWPRDMIEGESIESRTWRNNPDEFWSNELGYEFSPRLAMQQIGTNVMRDYFHNDIWTLTVKKQLLKNPDINYVLPDVRFYNERDLIKQLNGHHWQVRKGNPPIWGPDAANDNNYNSDFMRNYNVHESEYRWMDHDVKFDQVIKNDGTTTDLKVIVDNIMKPFDL